MTSVRRLEERLRAWRSFRGVARASRNLAAAQSRRWAESVRHAAAYLERCRALAGPYLSDPPPMGRAVLAVGTDLGLCGPLNTKVAEAAHRTWSGADLRLAVGRRLIDHVGEDTVVLSAPTSFAAAEVVAAELESWLHGVFGAEAELDIVVTTRVAADGGPEVDVVRGSISSPETGPARVALTPEEQAQPVAASLVRHARILWALCVAASSEAEVRWRVMHRAHESADRRIQLQEQDLRKRRQEVLTQEMLEARQGARLDTA